MESTTASELKSINVNLYLNLAAFSILVYDYCLTFIAEVERCWGIHRLNWAMGLFYMNRYLALFGHIPIMLEFFWSTSNPKKAEICHGLQSFHQYLAIVTQAIVAVMLIMRVYALYERNQKVLALYIIVSILMTIVALWAILSGKTEKNEGMHVQIGCGANLSQKKAVRLGAAWAAMLVFDSFVFGMTLYKSIVLPRPNKANTMSILFRDGTIYFGVILVSTVANVLTFMLGGPLTRGLGTMFTNIISSVMLSRLVLNLRKPRTPTILPAIPT